MDFITESDVEQKFIINLLTANEPFGLGYQNSEFLTKSSIRTLPIDKAGSKKLYVPDYIICLSGYSFCVIEAKRPGQDLIEAYREARLYASEINALYRHGVNPCSIVIATDGLRLLAGHYDSGDFIVDMIEEDFNPASDKFSKLIQLVGRRAVLNKCEELNKSLKKGAVFFNPKQLLGGKAVANQTVEQNTFGNNIAIEYRYLLNPDNQEEKRQIVENAYVTTKRKQGHMMSIDKIIRATTSVSQHAVTHIENSSNPVEFKRILENRSNLKGNVCLLVGGVGSGKSTFVRYLENRGLGKELSQWVCWHYLDMNSAPLTRDLIYDWVLDGLIASIKNENDLGEILSGDEIAKIYAKDFTAWEKQNGTWFQDNLAQKNMELYRFSQEALKDKNKTLKRLLELYYAPKDILPIVVFDNCDKGNKDDQLLMFEVANWLRDKYPFLIFLPLRDVTYDNFADKAPLDTVIKDMVFRVDPPDLEKVLRARVDYLQRDLILLGSNFEYTTRNGTKIQCKKEEIAIYLRCIIESLFSDQFIKSIIKGIVGRNVRLGLEIITDFCKSGHISEEEIFKLRTASGYKLGLPVVLNILLKGNRYYYSDEFSKIKNLFFSEAGDGLPDSLIRYGILYWANQRKSTKGPNGVKGWHKIGDVKSDLQKYGHDSNVVVREIECLLNANLLENETQDSDTDENSLIAITSVGVTHISLIKHFYYLSVVAEDCCFRENQVARSIANNMEGIGEYIKDSKGAKLDTSKKLLDYLIDYYKEYTYKGSAFVSNEERSYFTDLQEIGKSIKVKSDQESINNGTHYDEEYSPGKLVIASVSSIKDYGVFVEFDLGLVGIVFNSFYGSYSKEDIQNLEVGDQILVEVIEWQSEHRKYKMSLVEIN